MDGCPTFSTPFWERLVFGSWNRVIGSRAVGLYLALWREVSITHLSSLLEPPLWHPHSMAPWGLSMHGQRQGIDPASQGGGLSGGGRANQS